jgi:hypothetical protein
MPFNIGLIFSGLIIPNLMTIFMQMQSKICTARHESDSGRRRNSFRVRETGRHNCSCVGSFSMFGCQNEIGFSAWSCVPLPVVV